MSRPSGLKVSLLKDIGSDRKKLKAGQTQTYEGIDARTAAAVIEALGLDGDFEQSHVRPEYNSLLEELYITMPKRAHNCVTIWIRREFAKGERQNFFSEEESEYLEIDGDTGQCLLVCYSPVSTNNRPEFSGFSAPFANTTNCPDVYVSADELHYPTIVVESGFSESYRNLLRDKDVWLMGAAPHVNVVLLLSWSKVKKGMKATLEVFRKGGEHESFVRLMYSTHH